MSQPYDNILKENLEEMFLPLINRILDIQPLSMVELEDLQRTLERRPDFLKRIHTENGNFILHLEFQSIDHPGMAFRMLEYKALLLRKYELEVKQFVLYLGKGKSGMKTEVHYPNLQFRYDLLNFHDISYTEFLRSSIPEEVVLSILGNFEERAPAAVVEQILLRIKSLPLETFSLMKFVNQVEILSHLRGLQEFVIQKMPLAMPFIYNLETDIRYKQGYQKAQEEIQRLEQENRRIEEEKQRIEKEKQRIEKEKQRLEQENQRIEQEKFERQVRHFFSLGYTPKQIAELLQTTPDNIQECLNKQP